MREWRSRLQIPAGATTKDGLKQMYDRLPQRSANFQFPDVERRPPTVRMYLKKSDTQASGENLRQASSCLLTASPTKTTEGFEWPRSTCVKAIFQAHFPIKQRPPQTGLKGQPNRPSKKRKHGVAIDNAREEATVTLRASHPEGSAPEKVRNKQSQHTRGRTSSV